MFRDDEGEEWPEKQIMELEEVAGPDILRMVPKKGSPILTARTLRTSDAHISLDRPLRDLDAQLEQLALNAFSAPEPVLAAISLHNVIVSNGIFGWHDVEHDLRFQKS